MGQSDVHQNNILIVDDTPENLAVLTQMLTKQGYLVRPAINGQIALKAVYKALPDLILLDVTMPGMDGYEFCRLLKSNENSRDIPVIFISALGEIMDKVKAFQVGGIDYITKPFQVEEVVARVQTHLNLRNMQKRLQEQNIQFRQEIIERERSEEELRKLSRAVEQSASTIVITDANGTIEFANPAFFSVTGYSHQEIIGQNPRILKSGKHPPEFYQELWETIGRGEVWQGEFINKRKNGELYWEFTSISPVKDRNGKTTHYVAIKEDITKRKQTEALLYKLQKAVETTEVGITITDEQGRIVYINPADAKMHGYTVEELIGQRSNIFTTPDLRELSGFSQKDIDKLSNWKRERINVRRDGSVFPVTLISNPIRDKNDELIGNVIVCEDITERKQAEEALAKERNLLRTLIDSSPELIYVKDVESRFLLANKAVLWSMGLSSLDELVGKTDFDFHPVDLAGQFYESERPVIESGQPLINREEVIIDQETDEPRWLLSSKVPFRDNQGNILGLVGLNRDITKLKQTEKTLRNQAILLRGVAGAMTRLLVGIDFVSSIAETLEVLGFTTGVDRICIFETLYHRENEEPLMSQRFTWAQDLSGVQINVPELQNLSYSRGFTRWYEILSSNKILDGLVRDFPASERAILESQGIISTLVVPITIRDRFWGFIGFDRCQTERQWNEEEESTLFAMAGSIGGAIARQEAETKLITANNELKETLENLKRTQTQLIQSEKMAALGQLIAGVAHEINTPLGAIRSSIGTISNTLNQVLGQLPAFFRSLSEERQKDFFVLLNRSLQRDITFSVKEERKFKRTLIKVLQEYQLDNARKIAEILVNIGVYDSIEPFLPLLKDPQRDHILNIADHLSGLQESTRTIMTATERASRVVFALKTYSRYDQSGEMMKADIIEGIETVLTLYYNLLKRGVEVIRHYEELQPVICYPDELNQVWINLIHNALQAMNNKGTLTIEVREHEKQVVVSITDTGTGIPDDIKTKIFGPFFTTKPAGEGSGLGLDIVRKIIDKHQGSIEVESRPGKTTFSVWLPILSTKLGGSKS